MSAAASVDPRGQRLAAAITAAVLSAVMLTGSGWLLVVQAVVFAVGAVAGPASTPYAVLFRRFVRPRIGPPAATEDAAPPRFAQGVGLGFAVLGLLGAVLGAQWLLLAATAAALAAAFLNAAFGLCLGCELYLIIRRTFPRADRGAPSVEVRP